MTHTFLSLDLEMNQPSGKIIQIGACIGDFETGQIISDFSVYVNPQETIQPFITNLTGITAIHIKNGYTLQVAYDMLLAYIKGTGVFMNPITWGGDDNRILMEQLLIDIPNSDKSNIKWPFGHRYIDTKTLYVSWCIANNLQFKGGLSSSMNRVGLTFQGREHNAMYDAINTMRMYFKMLSGLNGIKL